MMLMPQDSFLESQKLLTIYTVILLQIAMVNPRTHFMKNHESQSRTNESYIKDARALTKP